MNAEQHVRLHALGNRGILLRAKTRLLIVQT